MLRRRTVTIAAGLAAALTLGLGIWAASDRIGAWWRYQTVKKLLDPAERERVFRVLLGWQRYRYPDQRRVPTPVKILEVRACPDGRFGSTFVVFFEFRPERDDLADDRDTGSAIQRVDSDGSLLPQPLHTQYGPLAQGHFGSVATETWEFVEAGRKVQVLSLGGQKGPDLLVAFHRDAPDGCWAWQLRAGDDPLRPEILLGPQDPASLAVTPRAVYRWDPTRNEYAGPASGVGHGFFQLHCEYCYTPVLEFARSRL